MKNKTIIMVDWATETVKQTLDEKLYCIAKLCVYIESQQNYVQRMEKYHIFISEKPYIILLLDMTILILLFWHQQTKQTERTIAGE